MFFCLSRRRWRANIALDDERTGLEKRADILRQREAREKKGKETSAAAAVAPAEREKEPKKTKGRKRNLPSFFLPPFSDVQLEEREKELHWKETEHERKGKNRKNSWPSCPPSKEAKTQKAGRKRKKKRQRTKKKNTPSSQKSKKNRKKALAPPTIPPPKQPAHQPAMSSLNPAAPAFVPSSSPPATEFDWEVRQRRKQRRNEAMKLRRRRKKSRREGAALLHAIGPLRAARSFI